MTASEDHAVGTTGGENEHVLTVDEIPNHYHSTQINRQAGNMNWGGLIGAEKVDGVTYGRANTSDVGGSKSHNNMPKFYAVYVWIRVA